MSHTDAFQENILELRYQARYLRAIETSGNHRQHMANSPIVVFLPAGLKYSVGPGRLFVSYARTLAKRGYCCYRFDPLGIGISDGELPSEPIHKHWNHIETGGFVEELAFFIRHIKGKNPGKKIVICGLCGGAITAILLADRYPQLVDGIVSINVEPFFSTEAPIPTSEETLTRINSVMKIYASKILSAAAWWRLLSLQSDIRGILRISTRFLLQGRQKGKKGLEDFSNLNQPLAESFKGIQKKGKTHLLLFSEHSKCWHNIQETFFAHLMDSRTSAPFQELKVIHQANHELQFKEWRDEALDYISEWLRENFGPS